MDAKPRGPLHTRYNNAKLVTWQAKDDCKELSCPHVNLHTHTHTQQHVNQNRAGKTNGGKSAITADTVYFVIVVHDPLFSGGEIR